MRFFALMLVASQILFPTAWAGSHSHRTAPHPAAEPSDASLFRKIRNYDFAKLQKDLLKRYVNADSTKVLKETMDKILSALPERGLELDRLMRTWAANQSAIAALTKEQAKATPTRAAEIEEKVNQLVKLGESSWNVARQLWIDASFRAGVNPQRDGNLKLPDGTRLWLQMGAEGLTLRYESPLPDWKDKNVIRLTGRQIFGTEFTDVEEQAVGIVPMLYLRYHDLSQYQLQTGHVFYHNAKTDVIIDFPGPLLDELPVPFLEKVLPAPFPPDAITKRKLSTEEYREAARVPGLNP